MGSYSSWAAFSLCHHLVVQYCAYRVGLYPFTNYILLGDDIVIKNTKVALEYIKVMTRLGVEISPTKTHVSNDTYEFAKRWIRYKDTRFVELSPLPIKGIARNITNPYIVFTILFDYFITKGNQYLYRRDLISLVCALYNHVTFYERVGKKTVKTAFKPSFLRKQLGYINVSMRYSMDLITYDKLREILA